MLNIIKKLFLKNKKPTIEIIHEKFGRMCFIPDGKYWEAAEGNIFHSMPGNEQGPKPEAIDFICTKLNSINHYWDICSEELLSIAHGWDSIDKNLPVKELFKLSAISVNSDDFSEWEICFETNPQHKWIYIGLHFHGEEIVENDIAT